MRLLPTPSYLWHWILVAFSAIALAGCADQYGQRNTPDDEAMKWARYDKKPPEDAAKAYFLPKSYYDPQRKEKAINDYFKGMDAVVVNPEAVSNPKKEPRPPYQLDTPVFQLLDKTSETPSFVFDDPIKSPNEILGRNTWMLWCGGNEGFWDWLATDSLGFIDLLKIVDSRDRQHRFEKGGLINEPHMAQSAYTEAAFGLWLDEPDDVDLRKWRRDYLSKTFKQIEERKHRSQRGLLDDQKSGYEDGNDRYSSGIQTGNYTKKSDATYTTDYPEDVPPPEIYGLSSGVIGLRLFPNPFFDAEAQKRWDAERFYNDPEYYNDPKLVRPFRVGVACAYCHASFHPLNPPKDIHNPDWENISGNIGAQYLRIRYAFGNLLTPDSFVYHLLDSQPPGTIDTSLIASDNINNPNTMNSVFGLTQRALLSFRNPTEDLSRTSANQPAIWRNPHAPAGSPLPDQVPKELQDFVKSQNALDLVKGSNKTFPDRYVPRILLDGSDSIGAWGALARVYLNIGTYYEQWIRLHRPVVGFEKQKPFTIADCEHHSVYWHATQDRVAALRDYFLKSSPPMPLAAAVVGKRNVDHLRTLEEKNAKLNMASDSGAPKTPSNPATLPAQPDAIGKELSEAKSLASQRIKNVINPSLLKRGRKVFANNCIVCHSSIQPESSAETLYSTNEKLQDEYRSRYQALIKQRNERREQDRKLGEFWEHDPGQWLRNSAYLDWAEEIVEHKEFWQFNYLSTDYRIPVNVVGTNASRAMATNALNGNMWDDFASESYQRMPSVGSMDFFNPYKGPNGEIDQFLPRHKAPDGIPEGGGGPGFYRVPTLISIWSTAPYLHNNTLGVLTNDPSLDGRMKAFNDGIQKLLTPELRSTSSSYNQATPDRLKRDHGLIWRTENETYLTISGRRLPTLLSANVRAVMEIRDKYPWLETIRPIGLPSAILVIASFLLLLLDCERHRHNCGWGLIGFAALQGVVGWAHQKFGWFECLEQIHPIWLPLALTLTTGVLLLVIDQTRRLRIFALFGIAVAVIGFTTSWFFDDNKWVRLLLTYIPTAWICLLIVLASLILLATQWRSTFRLAIAYLLFLAAAAGVVVYMHDAYAGEAAWANYVGPVWIYSLLLVAGGVILLVPDPNELRRHLGYSSLILAIGTGAALYFFNGRLGDITIGPIPKGTPVSLLANLNPDAKPADLARALKITIGTFAEIESKHLDEKAAQKLLLDRVAPALMSVNKCPDFVMDKGHYFEWFNYMSAEDKSALIELLKTF